METYTALPINSLKPATVKTIAKFLDGVYKEEGIVPARDESGMYVNPLPPHALAKALTNTQGVVTLTLAALAATKANEVFEQLPINESKVESLVSSICKLSMVVAPPVLGIIRHTADTQTAIIIAGRHRNAALLTISQLVPNWADLLIGVYVDDRYRNQRELISAVELYNVSRSVTTTEKAQYRLTAKGLTAGESFREIMNSVLRGEFTSADLGAVARVAARNWVDEHDVSLFVDSVGTTASGAALGNFGNGALSAFTSKSGAWNNPLVQEGKVSGDQLKAFKKYLVVGTKTENGTVPALSVFLESCLTVLANNWPQFFEQMKVNPSDTSVNFARNSAAVGRAVGVKVLEQLLPTFTQLEGVAAQEEAAKKAASKRKSAASQLKSMYAAYSQLVALGDTLPQQHLQGALAQMAQTAQADLGISPEEFFAAMQNGGVLPEKAGEGSSLPAPAIPQAAAAPVGGQAFML
jgi:hypothetical protein